MKINVKYTLFLDFSKGGYLRTFTCPDYPGMRGSVGQETRDHEVKRLFFIDGDETVYTTIESAVDAYKKLK